MDTMIKNNNSSLKRLAILYDCPYPYVLGGGQKRLFEIATRLIKENWTIDWFSLKFWDGNQEIEHNGINYHAVGEKVNLYDPTGKRNISETIYYGMKSISAAELRYYDIILAGQWPYFHLFPAKLFSMFGRGKLIVDWWEIWGNHWFEYYGLKGSVGVMLERICSRLPDGIVSISQTGKRKLEGIGVSPSKIRTIHNGIDILKIRETPPAFETTDLIYVGRLQNHKNVNHLIEGMSILIKQYKLQLTLQIIGGGPEKNYLEQLASNLGISDCVRFYGEVKTDEEVYSRMKSAKVFIHPSTKEGGGSITSLEANACGLPVIAYRHPDGISEELIKSGYNGYWVNKIGSEFLAEKINEVIKTGNYLRITQDCIKFSEDFDWSKISMEYNDYFRSMLK